MTPPLTDAELAELYSQFCECRPLDMDRTSHSHDCGGDLVLRAISELRHLRALAPVPADPAAPLREIRVKIDCVVRVPGETLPAINKPLDIVEGGVRALGAAEILPGARVHVSFTRQESIRIRAGARRKL